MSGFEERRALTAPLYTARVALLFLVGEAPHRPPRDTPELAMKHRPFEAVYIILEHGGRMNEALSRIP